MFWKHTIGQESIKKHLRYLLESSQVPHAQLFKSSSGNGNLVLGIEFSLHLLKLNEHSLKTRTLGEFSLLFGLLWSSGGAQGKLNN